MQIRGLCVRPSFPSSGRKYISGSVSSMLISLETVLSPPFFFFLYTCDSAWFAHTYTFPFELTNMLRWMISALCFGIPYHLFCVVFFDEPPRRKQRIEGSRACGTCLFVGHGTSAFFSFFFFLP